MIAESWDMLDDNDRSGTNDRALAIVTVCLGKIVLQMTQFQ